MSNASPRCSPIGVRLYSRMSAQESRPLGRHALWFSIFSIPLFGYWLTNGLWLDQLSGHLSVLYSLDAFFLLILPLLTFAAMPRTVRPSRLDLGLTSISENFFDILGTTILCCVLLGFSTWIVSSLSWAFLWRFDWIYGKRNIFSWAAVLPTGLMGYLGKLYLAVSAGFVEEIYFRGLFRHVLYSVLPKRFRESCFLVASAIAFGAIHWEGGLARLVATAIIGLLAARLFTWLGTLWPLIFAHIVVDLAAL